MPDAHLKEVPLARTELLRGHFLHVVRDTVRLPTGAEATREFVLHPGAVMVIGLLDDGRVVLERQYRHPMQAVMVEFPAGKLDPGEGSLACGRRAGRARNLVDLAERLTEGGGQRAVEAGRGDRRRQIGLRQALKLRTGPELGEHAAPLHDAHGANDA